MRKIPFLFGLLLLFGCGAQSDFIFPQGGTDGVENDPVSSILMDEFNHDLEKQDRSAVPSLVIAFDGLSRGDGRPVRTLARKLDETHFLKCDENKSCRLAIKENQ